MYRAYKFFYGLRRALAPTWVERYEDGYEWARAVTDPELGAERLDPEQAMEAVINPNDAFDVGVMDYLYIRYGVERPDYNPRLGIKRRSWEYNLFYFNLLMAVLAAIAIFM